jgi:hypothetical protein
MFGPAERRRPNKRNPLRSKNVRKIALAVLDGQDYQPLGAARGAEPGAGRVRISAPEACENQNTEIQRVCLAGLVRLFPGCPGAVPNFFSIRDETKPIGDNLWLDGHGTQRDQRGESMSDWFDKIGILGKTNVYDRCTYIVCSTEN